MYLELRENKMHGTKAYPYTQYHVKDVKQIFQFPVHWHEEVELIYIEQGTLTLHISGEQMEGSKGDVFFINSGELHFMGSRDPQIRYYAILFPLTFLSFQSEDTLESQLMRPLRTGNCRFPVRIESEITRKKIVKILEKVIAWNREYTAPQIQTRICLLELIQILWEEHLFQYVFEKKRGTVQREILTYIQQHYTEKVSLGELSKEFHMSEKYLSRYFKEQFAITFKQYVLHLRLLKAKDTLENTEQSVLEVSLVAGFPSVNYFIRVFKEQYGITPLQYRKGKR